MPTTDRLPQITADRQNGDAAPGVIATNLRKIGKKTLVDSCDIEIPKWRIKIRGVMRHRSGGGEWIQFPAREWVDSAGAQQFAKLLEFTDKEVEERFKTAALTAMRALADEKSTTPEPGGQA